MQTVNQNPCAAATVANPVKVFHAIRNIQLEFDPSVGAEWGVAYAYCEDNKRMSELFSHRDAGTLPELYAKLPFTRGKQSVACGDWMACVRTSAPTATAQVVTADDIEHVLQEYSLRVLDTQGKSFETMAAELVDELDLSSVIQAAAAADTLTAKQQAVFDALHTLLVKEGVIDF